MKAEIKPEVLEFLETKEGKRKFSEIVKENGFVQSKSDRNFQQAVYTRRKDFKKIPRSVREWASINALLEEHYFNNN